eukprot:753643-Hanusia_phi.AAC.5
MSEEGMAPTLQELAVSQCKRFDTSELNDNQKDSDKGVCTHSYLKAKGIQTCLQPDSMARSCTLGNKLVTSPPDHSQMPTHVERQPRIRHITATRKIALHINIELFSSYLSSPYPFHAKPISRHSLLLLLLLLLLLHSRAPALIAAHLPHKEVPGSLHGERMQEVREEEEEEEEERRRRGGGEEDENQEKEERGRD